MVVPEAMKHTSTYTFFQYDCVSLRILTAILWDFVNEFTTLQVSLNMHTQQKCSVKAASANHEGPMAQAGQPGPIH